MLTRQSGFTIVELLIVIVVISILAAITIVAFSGIQQRALDAVIRVDLKANRTKLLEYQTINGQYPAYMGVYGKKMPSPCNPGTVDANVYCPIVSSYEASGVYFPNDPGGASYTLTIGSGTEGYVMSEDGTITKQTCVVNAQPPAAGFSTTYQCPPTPTSYYSQ